ncbi:MAG TPA: bifunctional DNA primase/polymerase [Urbifossiella sp.]|nr:bifunctional DNA primase/polymerase [Urbifossiella sp.]
MSNPYLAAALDFASRGWCVVPCTPRQKKPWLTRWQENNSSDADTIRGWWRHQPDSNVGVYLGCRSMLVAIDNDSDAGSRMLLDMSAGDLPDTCEMTTGKGSRLLYAIPELLEFEPKTVATLKDEYGKEALRFQSKGAQCVMPPSVHPGDVEKGIPPGRVYAWVEGRSPADLEPAPMPGWLIEAMRPGGLADEEHPERPNWSDAVPSNIPRDESFNLSANWWDHVLQPAGFSPSSPARGDRGSYRYCRPGKRDSSIGVTVGYYKAKDGTDALYVFSGSIPGLEALKCYDMFGAFARLFYRGDFAAAARAAVAKGIIKARPRRVPPRIVWNGRAFETGRSAGTGPADDPDALPAAWRDDGYPDLGRLTPAESRRWLERIN